MLLKVIDSGLEWVRKYNLFVVKLKNVFFKQGDLKNWEGFRTKYMNLQKRFAENYNVKVDADKELTQLAILRDKMMNYNMITDTVLLLHKALQSDKRILYEGANATMLDIDFGLIINFLKN